MKKMLALSVGLATLLAVIGFVGSTSRASADPTGQVKWSGDVDDTGIVYIHNDQVTTENVSGHGITTTHVRIGGRMPHGHVRVRIVDWTGRGNVEIIRQPRRDNEYTAAVQINDPQAGTGHYHFTLQWDTINR